MVGTDIQVSVPRGEVARDIKEYAERKVRRALERAPAPVLLARVSMEELGNPAAQRPLGVSVVADINGRVVRVRAEGTTWVEAVDLLADKLQDEVEHLKQRRRARRQRAAQGDGEDAWRHGDPPTPRADHHPRDPDDRDLVAREAWVPEPAGVAEALAHMRELGHEFQLFVEQSTGTDAVVSVSEDGGVVVTLAGDRPPDTTGVDGSIEVRQAAPHLHVDEAIEALDTSGASYVFFVDAVTGRGALLHHRYDGHLGLVTSPVAGETGAGD